MAWWHALLGGGRPSEFFEEDAPPQSVPVDPYKVAPALTLPSEVGNFFIDSLKDVAAAGEYAATADDFFLKGAGSFEGAEEHLRRQGKVREKYGTGQHPNVDEAIGKIMQAILPEAVLGTLEDPRMQYNLQYLPALGYGINRAIKTGLKAATRGDAPTITSTPNQTVRPNQEGIIKMFDEADIEDHPLFESAALTEALAQNPKSREILLSMTPDEFKELAYPLDNYKDIQTDALRESVVDRGEKLRDIPQLWFDNKLDQPARITGHEGRHRAEILSQLGQENMPVRFISREYGDAPAIRWGMQDEPSFDTLHRDDWPAVLANELGDVRIPFPIERPLGMKSAGKRTERANEVMKKALGENPTMVDMIGGRDFDFADDLINQIEKEFDLDAEPDFGFDYPIAPRDRWYADADYQQRGGDLVDMPPDDFLDRAAPLKMDAETRENIDYLKEHMQSGGELDPLTIYGDKSSVRNSDGRHRAIAAKELGMDTVPVVDLRPKGQRGNIDMFSPMVGRRREFFPGFEESSLLSLSKAGSRPWSEELGYWHEIGGKRMDTPIDQLSRVISQRGDAPQERMISPEALRGKSWFPLPGDRSQGGVNLWGINDVNFKQPVHLGGGYEFGILDPWAYYASKKGAMSRFQNQAQAIRDRGRDPIAMFTPQSHDTINFNDMVTDTMYRQIEGLDLEKPVKDAFDAEMRRMRPEWKGLDDPDSLEQLEKVGEVRKRFNAVAGMKQFKEHGFPSLSDAKYAVTHPDLLNYSDVPMYSSGRAMFEVGDETRPSGHGTYDTEGQGNYFGGIEKPLPIEIAYRDWWKERRRLGKPEEKDASDFLWQRPTQDATQEVIDAMMQFLGK